MTRLNAPMTSLLDRTAAVGDRLRQVAVLPRLQGPRIHLRGPQDGDADIVFELFSDPDTMRYWSRPPMRQKREAEAYIESIGKGVAEHSYLNWLIADADDRMIGSCTIYDIQPPHLRAGIGYALLPQCRGQGVASEAVSLALRWGFGVLGLHKFEADAHPDNAASQRLLERLGFRHEGLLRQRFVHNDEIQDSSIYGLLEAEFRPLL